VRKEGSHGGVVTVPNATPGRGTSPYASRYRSSRAGVAQQAEQPSCKRTTEVAQTWPFVATEARFGMYWAQSPASFLTARGVFRAWPATQKASLGSCPMGGDLR
jgi:hypothetical protein